MTGEMEGGGKEDDGREEREVEEEEEGEEDRERVFMAPAGVLRHVTMLSSREVLFQSGWTHPLRSLPLLPLALLLLLLLMMPVPLPMRMLLAVLLMLPLLPVLLLRLPLPLLLHLLTIQPLLLLSDSEAANECQWRCTCGGRIESSAPGKALMSTPASASHTSDFGRSLRTLAR